MALGSLDFSAAATDIASVVVALVVLPLSWLQWSYRSGGAHQKITPRVLFLPQINLPLSNSCIPYQSKNTIGKRTLSCV
jgi:hypothetical protein